jgi:hypothetical protein
MIAHHDALDAMMRWASGWTKKNAIFAIPAIIAIAYVAAYVIAFPRYGFAGSSARLCRYDWEQSVWFPLASVEKSCRTEHFEFVSTEGYQKGYGQSPATIARDLGIERVWP